MTCYRRHFNCLPATSFYCSLISKSHGNRNAALYCFHLYIVRSTFIHAIYTSIYFSCYLYINKWSQPERDRREFRSQVRKLGVQPFSPKPFFSTYFLLLSTYFGQDQELSAFRVEHWAALKPKGEIKIKYWMSVYSKILLERQTDRSNWIIWWRLMFHHTDTTQCILCLC